MGATGKQPGLTQDTEETLNAIFETPEGEPLSFITPEVGHWIDAAIQAIPEHQLRANDAEAPGLDPDVSRDPFSAFGRLREREGDVVQYIDGAYGDVRVYNVFGHDLSRPNFAVLGCDSIRRMVMDKESFINSGAYGAFGVAQGGVTTVNEQDGEEHRLTRRLFDREILSRDKLLKLSEDSVGPTANFLAKRVRKLLKKGDKVDLRRHIALPIVYISISRIIGIPIQDLVYFVEQGEKAFGGSRDFEGAQRAVVELNAYFAARYEERKAMGPAGFEGGDLMSMMSSAEANGRRFSEAEIITYCWFLIPGAIETTWRQAANLCMALMAHPEQYEQIVENPELIPQAVEEALRWMASGFTLPRICGRKTVLAGVEIPEGSSMVGVFGVANRDPRVWNDAERFDIHRERQMHLTFSGGIHSCMGQHLARTNLQRALEAMVRHLPDIEADCDLEDLGSEGFNSRCATEVPIRIRQ